MYLLANKKKKCAKAFMANCKNKSEDEMNMGMYEATNVDFTDTHASNIVYAFVWDKTKEGSKYWFKMYEWCEQNGGGI